MTINMKKLANGNGFEQANWNIITLNVPVDL